jgi:Protein of unknown function (DUF2569)
MTDAGATLPTEPKGIGGWLILPMLTTLVSPLLILRTIVETFPALETELSSGLRAFVIGEIVFNLALIVGWIFVAVQLFRHRRSFPGLFIAMLRSASPACWRTRSSGCGLTQWRSVRRTTGIWPAT